jgi:hypothetical protein
MRQTVFPTEKVNKPNLDHWVDTKLIYWLIMVIIIYHLSDLLER